MALKAGTLTERHPETGELLEWESSLAEAMEKAMEVEWKALNNGSELPAEGEESRRLLFAAIAQGILGYLKAYQTDGIKVKTKGEQSSPSLIKSQGTVTLGTTKITVDSKQLAGDDNQVRTTEDDGQVEFLTEGVLHPVETNNG